MRADPAATTLSFIRPLCRARFCYNQPDSMERLQTVTFAVLAAFALPASERPCTTFAEARAHADDACAFVLTGQVLADENGVLVVSDKTGGARVHPPAHVPPGRVGDVIRIQGHRRFYADRLERLASRPLPAPAAADAAHVASGARDYSLVSVTGVVSSVTRDELDPDWAWFVLRTESGPISVSVKSAEFPPAALERLIDTAAAVRGVAVPFSSWRRPLGSHLLVNGRDALVPLDDAASPPLTHRQTAPGRLLAATTNHLYLRLRDGRLARAWPLPKSPRPPAGSAVTVTGFASDNDTGLDFTDALVMPAGVVPATADVARVVSPRRLFTTVNGQPQVNTDLHGQIVRLTGRVQGTVDAPAGARALTLDCQGHAVTVDLSGIAAPIPERDSVLEATGLCLAAFETVSTTAAYPLFKGFTLVPRTAADLRVLAPPPWWTPLLLFSVIAALAVLLVLILVWNRALQTRSERRGRELADEQIDHARAELKVEERTHLAVELHDSISQMLTGVSLQIDAALGCHPAKSGPSSRYLETARQILAACRHELRGCLWDLRSRTFEEKDLTEAVVRTLAPYAGETALAVRFNVPRDRLSETLTHTILRIVRELTVNAIRHGKARQVKVAGELQGDVIRFSVRDDGCGFDPATAPSPSTGHFGLVGVRERAAAVGGQVEIASAPGCGARVAVTLPARKEIDET